MNARRLTALLEVLGVYVTGQYLVTLFVATFHLPVENPLLHINAQISDTELLFAARDLFFVFLMQYAGWFVLIVPINWWHRRTGPAAYGLTRAGKSWGLLLATGVVTAAVTAWPEMSVQLLDTVYDLGPTVPWRQAYFDMSWRRWEFWLFSAVLSWAFVAFMEELFFRGYCQRRLAEDWGDGPAILGTACLFLFSHGQYLFLNAYNVSLIASLFVLAIGFGVIFAGTRSIIPSFVAHAIINFPMTPRWQVVVLAIFLIGIAIFGRRAVAAVKKVFSGASVLWCVVLASGGAACAVAMQYGTIGVYVAAAMLGLALGLESLHSSREPAAQSASTLFK